MMYVSKILSECWSSPNHTSHKIVPSPRLQRDFSSRSRVAIGYLFLADPEPSPTRKSDPRTPVPKSMCAGPENQWC
ncbi:hypothetical protein NPIL_342031 [Nephila pilipes]|uniref:Uncharacterized protein n=1 Tax=Nephila pilipes TaxID=299642 RepID=A0A8X6ITJ6_NEPPI|nr:hypothetical protein NPIL_342031 [Nephila pilipes]